MLKKGLYDLASSGPSLKVYLISHRHHVVHCDMSLYQSLEQLIDTTKPVYSKMKTKKANKTEKAIRTLEKENENTKRVTRRRLHQDKQPPRQENAM